MSVGLFCLSSVCLSVCSVCPLSVCRSVLSLTVDFKFGFQFEYQTKVHSKWKKSGDMIARKPATTNSGLYISRARLEEEAVVSRPLDGY